jgi:hypothetical protein
MRERVLGLFELTLILTLTERGGIKSEYSEPAAEWTRLSRTDLTCFIELGLEDRHQTML